MSFDRFKWMNGWVKDDESLSPGAMAVMVVIFCHTDKHGKSWCSKSTIARESGHSERRVKKYIDEAHQSKWLKAQERPGKSTVVTAVLPDESAKPAPTPERKTKPKTKAKPKPQPPTPQPNPAVAEVEDGDPPEQQLLQLSQKAGVNLSVFQAEQAWRSVCEAIADEEERWRYIKTKLADLERGIEGDTVTRRAAFRYLCDDAAKWKKHKTEGNRVPITEDQEKLRDFARKATERTNGRPDRMAFTPAIEDIEDDELPF